MDKGIPSFSRSANTSATSASETSSYVVVPLSFTFSHTFMAKDFNPPLICCGVAFTFGVVVAAASEPFLDNDGGGVDIIIALFPTTSFSSSFFTAAPLFFTGVFLFLPEAASFLFSSSSLSSSVFVLSKYSAICTNNFVLASRASFASFSSYGSFCSTCCLAPIIASFSFVKASLVLAVTVFVANNGGRTRRSSPLPPLLVLFVIPFDNDERLFAFRLALIGGLVPIFPPNTVAGDPSRAKPVKGRCRPPASWSIIDEDGGLKPLSLPPRL